MTSPIEMRGGTLEQGLKNGRRLLDDHPEAALMQARTLLRLGPDPRAFRLAAAAHRTLGQAAEAEAAELHAMKHSLQVPLVRRAAEAEQAGRADEAGVLAAQQLAQEPDDLLAMTISGITAIAARRLTEAEDILCAVLERAPSFLRASMMLGRTLTLQCRMAEAIDVMERAVSKRPQNQAAQALLAQFYAEAGNYAAAATAYERLLELNGNEPSMWASYGDVLRFLGRQTDSESAYRRALLADQACAPAWWGLADLNAASLTDQDLVQIQTALEERAANPEDSGLLHFALGAVLDERGQHEHAFHHFSEGNQQRQGSLHYDRSILSREIDRSIELFTRGFFAQRRDGAVLDPNPIFILGMPRAGSTLLERIVGRHSQVEATGELPIIPRMIENLSAEDDVHDYREILCDLNGSELRTLGLSYLRSAGEFRKTGKPLFTDKLHMNWRHAGFIHLILPKARIIDLRRNALDCCWSNYRQLFTAVHPAANDLQDIGQFYAAYVRMMDHMCEVASDVVLQVRYEDVVDNIERETRRILDFLGLPFEAQCLTFHESADTVATASSEQVRQPINRKGIGVSQPYFRWLGPLRDVLGPLADH